MKIVDLSRELYQGTPTYPGHPPIIHGVWKTHEESFAESGKVHGLSSMFISMPDHAGTHIDAPRHFSRDGQPMNEYPLENCIVPGICIDLRHVAPRAEIAAGYPERPVKIIVSFAPGGPTDTMARILAGRLGDAIGGTFIVENKPGAGGNIGIGAAAHAEPDGHTLLITSSAYVVNPGLYAKIPYDPYKDFAPIAELGASPNAILVDPRLGVDSIAALIARAKANPDELNYASPGIGTTAHLSGELFKIVGGIQIAHVPFSGAGPAIQAILSGTTQVAVTALAPAHAHIESGALKVLAVTGVHRWFDLPDVPSMVELGYKDFVSDTFQGFFAPVKTSPAIVELLSTRSIEILRMPVVAEQLRNNGFEVIANGPEGMRKRIDDEVPKWRDVIAKAGIKPV